MQTRKAVVQVRGVKDVSVYLRLKSAHLNGTPAKNMAEANIGEILANALSIKNGDRAELAFGRVQIKINITGTFRSQTQSDAEIIIPMEAADKLDGDKITVSLIEFTLKEDVNAQTALNQIVQQLPQNVKLIQTQQLKVFAKQMNAQTLSFLNIWTLAVYAVVAAASYITAVRLIAESSYEFTMLKALGARKPNFWP